LTGNSKGTLHPQRQVEDYVFRGQEFERMGFLNFTVETYERRLTISKDVRSDEDKEEMNNHNRYLKGHPKETTHIRIHRSEFHNFLPNIVGMWLPRRDGDESTKLYYFAAMLALLKPWRDLYDLKDAHDGWEMAFNKNVESMNQRDKDVIAGCQYYYDSRTALGRNDDKDDDVGSIDIGGEEAVDDKDEDLYETQDESNSTSVSEMSTSSHIDF
jgi:hypothetical protein